MGHMSPQKTFEEGAMAYQPVISIQRNGTFNIFNHIHLLRNSCSETASLNSSATAMLPVIVKLLIDFYHISRQS